MKQLSPMDSLFLYFESPNAPMHISSLSIFDPSTAPQGKVRFKDIIKSVIDGADLVPHMRRRLVEVPFGADFPYWINDETFDPEYHIRHIGLPQPGDWRQLCIQVARIIARPLDRTRPLWENYIIEGLNNIEGIPNGSFACLSKIHHACIDGAAGTEVGAALANSDGTAPAEPWVPDEIPSPEELLGRAYTNFLKKPAKYDEYLAAAVPRWQQVQEKIAAGELVAESVEVPRTRFNGPISPHRVVEAVVFDLDEIKVLKNAAGVTVNDMVLAICSGALRIYLLDKNELPDLPLVSLCPINMRDPENLSDESNVVSSMSVKLATHIADPKKRVAEIHRTTKNAKEMTHAIGAKAMLDPLQFMQQELQAMGARSAAHAHLTDPTANTTITNVPGSQVAQYDTGAKKIRYINLGVSSPGNALMHAAGSYCGELSIGITCCRDIMPDPEFYADCLRASFEELKGTFITASKKAKAAVV